MNSKEQLVDGFDYEPTKKSNKEEYFPRIWTWSKWISFV